MPKTSDDRRRCRYSRRTLVSIWRPAIVGGWPGFEAVKYRAIRLPAAKSAFDAASSSRRKIMLSVIRLAEVVYLVEKNRLPASAYADLLKALRDQEHVLEEAPVTAEIIDAMLEVSRADIPDLLI